MTSIIAVVNKNMKQLGVKPKNGKFDHIDREEFQTFVNRVCAELKVVVDDQENIDMIYEQGTVETFLVYIEMRMRPEEKSSEA